MDATISHAECIRRIVMDKNVPPIKRRQSEPMPVFSDETTSVHMKIRALGILNATWRL